MNSDLYQLVYVENTGDTELSFPIPGVDRAGNYLRAHIDPGDRKLMTFDVVASAFGHPAARDNGKDKGRTEMFRDLRTYWGWHEGFDTDLAADQLHRDMGWTSWQEKCPKFRVTTLEGAWIPMVLDDPEGIEPLPDENGVADPSVARASGNAAVMDRTLQAMQEKSDRQEALIEQLMKRLGMSDGDEQAPADSPHTPADDVQGGAKTTTPPVPVEVPQSSELPQAPADEPPPTADRPRTVRARNAG